MAGSATPSPWLTEGEEKRNTVRRMFAEIAPTYDAFNSLICLRGHRRWRRIAVKTVAAKPGERALDLCCGTGDFLSELRRAVGPEGYVEGIDFCQPMLDIAAKKLDPAVKLVLGDATALPQESESFDIVTVGWGLRNVPDVKAALSEAARVLKPGGRFVCLDMSEPKSRLVGGISRRVFHLLVPMLGTILGNKQAYTYLPKSTERFMTREQLSDAMREAGFEGVKTRDFIFGNVCMHWGSKS